MLTLDRIQPDQADITAANEALPAVREYLATHPDSPRLQMIVDDEHGTETLTVPRAAVELLAPILAHMAAGHGIAIVPSHAELTTQQAADMLNVSRPFLIGLLESGEIEYRKVGKHRRVQAASLLDYMRADDQRRREAADELSALTQQMGLA
ncbi:MAG: helix-turn-helix domain-containing protein [Sciscionella sp.]